MKKLISILIFAAIAFTTNAQSAIVPLDASGSVVTGGDGTGKIVSASWAATTSPYAISFTDSSGNTGTNQGLKTYVKITKGGTYVMTLTVTDNLGNNTTGDVQIIAYDAQKIEIRFVAPIIKAYLK